MSRRELAALVACSAIAIGCLMLAMDYGNRVARAVQRELDKQDCAAAADACPDFVDPPE